jgi:hypothetical protein
VLADVTVSKVATVCGRAAVNIPCFTASQFAPPAAAPPFTTQADFGNLPRNSFRGPGYFNLDSKFFKSIPVSERMRLTFGASAYNLFNHPNFASPNSDIAFPGLGLITSTTTNPSGPYGIYGGPSGRAVVINSKLQFLRCSSRSSILDEKIVHHRVKKGRCYLLIVRAVNTGKSV